MTTPTPFLRTGFIISITLLLPLYLGIVLFTGYSLTGYWTDVIFFLPAFIVCNYIILQFEPAD